MMAGLPLKIDPDEPSHSLYEGVEYTQFWEGAEKQRLDGLEHAIVTDLLPGSGRRIIDLGCGYGRLSDCYMDRFEQVIMVDGSMSLLQQAVQKTGGKAVYIAADATHLPFRMAAFDAVLMIRVFHHIEDSRACLSELHRILCDDGRLVFSYRNKLSALRAIQWLLGRAQENPFTTGPAGVGSTLISHHPRAVDRLLRESGFSGVQYDGAGVLDWIAARIGVGDRWGGLDERLAPLFGITRIAPWILCGAIAGGNPELIDVQRIGDLLVCPSCGGNLSEDGWGHQCAECGRRYPVEDGIIDLRV